MMSPARLLGLFGLLFTTLLAAIHAAPDLAELVDDRSVVAIQIRDFPALRHHFDAAPYRKFWDDENVAAFFAPMRKKLADFDWRAFTNDRVEHDLTDLLGWVTGDLLAVVEQPYEITFEGEPGQEWPLLLVVQIGDNRDRIEPLLEKAAEHFVRDGGSRATEEHGGVMLHLETPSRDAEDSFRAGLTHPLVWAFHEGHLFISDNRPGVLTALDALQGRSVPSPLARTAAYEEALTRNPKAELIALVRPEKLLPLYQDELLEMFPGGPGMLAAMNLDGPRVARLLGLDAIEGLYATASMEGNQTLINAGMSYREATGLIRLLAYRDGPLSLPDWVPASWFSAASTNIGINDVFAEVERLIESFNPMFAAAFQQQIRHAGQQIGVDIKRDLLGNMGGVIVNGQAVPTHLDAASVTRLEEVNTLMAFSLNNAAGFERALNTLKVLGGPALEQFVVERDYLGQKLFVFTPPMAPEGGGQAISYVIAENYFMLGVGEPGALEPVLQQIDARRPSFWMRDEVVASLDAMPSSAAGFQFNDLRLAILSGLAQMTNRQKLAGLNPDQPEYQVDPAAMPTVEQLTPYFSHVFSYVLREPRGLHLHAFIPHDQP